MSSTFIIPAGTADGAALTIEDSAILAASAIVGTLDAGASGLAGVDVMRVGTGQFTLGVRTLVAGGVTSAPATFTYHVHDDDFDASDVLRVHDLAASGAIATGPGGAPGMTQRGAHDPAATYAPGDVVTDSGGLYVNTAALSDNRADTFARPDQEGFGTGTDGHAWLARGLAPGTLRVRDGGGEFIADANGATDMVRVVGTPFAASFDMLLAWQVRVATDSDAQNYQLSLLLSLADNWQTSASWGLLATGAMSFGSSSPVLNNTPTFTSTTPESPTFTPGAIDARRWTRMRLNAGTLTLRTWLDGDDEPAEWDWQGDGYVPNAGAGGGLGLHGSVSNSGDVLAIDHVSATTYPPPPTPADDPAHWTPLGLHRRGAHDSAAMYAAGALVTDGGGLYQAIAAVVPDTRADTFARSDQSGWGTASDGHAWSYGYQGDSTEVISSHHGQQVAGATHDPSLLLAGPALQQADAEILVSWSIATGSSSTNGLVLNIRGDREANVRAELTVHLSGSSRLEQIGLDPIPDAVVASWVGAATGDLLWTRLRAVGNPGTYRWRTWADDDSEPASWDGTASAGTFLDGRSILVGGTLEAAGDTLYLHCFNATTSFLAPADDATHWAPLADLRGLPRLYGPYTVNFSDIPHDGDTMTLWTPQVGDVLLRLFCDWQTGTMWDHGRLFIGQNVDGTTNPPTNAILPFLGGISELAAFDNIWQETVFDAGAVGHGTTVYFFHTTDPVQIQLAQTSGTDPTQGHVALYALVARAVAP